MRAALVFGLLLTTISPAAANMGLGFGWGPTKQCFDPNSPPITIADVPQRTATLRFKLTDLDAADFNHGGGDVNFQGQETLPYGAFTYKGPARRILRNRTTIGSPCRRSMPAARCWGPPGPRGTFPNLPYRRRVAAVSSALAMIRGTIPHHHS